MVRLGLARSGFLWLVNQWLVNQWLPVWPCLQTLLGLHSFRFPEWTYLGPVFFPAPSAYTLLGAVLLSRPLKVRSFLGLCCFRILERPLLLYLRS